jgi:hypothetical protein
MSVPIALSITRAAVSCTPGRLSHCLRCGVRGTTAREHSPHRPHTHHGTASDASPPQTRTSSRPPRTHGHHLRPSIHCSKVRQASHCETGVVSRGLLGLLDAWTPLPTLSRAGGPAAADALARLVLFLAACPDRHRFCFLRREDAEKHGQDDLCCRWVGLSRRRKGSIWIRRKRWRI